MPSTHIRILRARYARLPMLAMCAVVAGIWRLTTPAPPEPTQAGVAVMLGQAIEGEVGEDAYVWEHSAGSARDLLDGRRILFLGAVDGPRDLYRARVSVSRDGKPLQVLSVYNLSQTELADESSLTAVGHHAAYVTRALDSIQAVSALSLAPPRPADLTWLQRLALWIRNRARYGSGRAIARVDVSFASPPDAVEIELDGGRLLMALGEAKHAAAVELDSGALTVSPDDEHGAYAWTSPAYEPSARGAFAEALLEGLAWLPLPNVARAWLDEPAPADAARPSNDQVPVTADDENVAWPPKPAAGASWEKLGVASLPPPLGDGADYLLRAQAREGDAEVVLLAIDSRQLELRLVAGSEHPRPSLGPPGAGVIPSADYPRLVAAFGGAAASHRGMMVRRRMLTAPVRGEGTLAIDADGDTHIGAWPHDGVPERFTSLRQASLLDLAANAPGAVRERSALCVTRGGFLVYAHSAAIDAAALARTLRGSGCAEALAWSGSHQGLALLGGGDAQNAVVLSEGMSLEPSRFLHGSADDFVYLLVRDPTPRFGAALSWKADDGAQPPPAWLPAAYRSNTEQLGTEVELHAFAPDRFAWQIRPGDRERAGRTADGSLTAAEQARAMVAIGLGVGFRRDNRRGLVLDGVISLPIRPDLGVLTTSKKEGTISIARSLEDMAPYGDATELVLLAEAGEIRSEARKLGARRRRAAACIQGDGRLIVALATFDSAEPVTLALLELGCRRVVELNRGRQVAAFIHRAGSDAPPQSGYDATTLYGMAREGRGTARCF